MDGEQMVRFMAWANGIFTFNPTASLFMEGAHWIFRLHIFLGLTIFLLFPFTRLVHMLSAPVQYLWRGGYQIRSEEHTSELQSLMRISYAVFCLTKKKNIKNN